eukprot:jgi/Psemu1/284722/fgenesh1_pg.62_\
MRLPFRLSRESKNSSAAVVVALDSSSPSKSSKSTKSMFKGLFTPKHLRAKSSPVPPDDASVASTATDVSDCEHSRAERDAACGRNSNSNSNSEKKNNNNKNKAGRRTSKKGKLPSILRKENFQMPFVAFALVGPTLVLGNRNFGMAR